MLKLFEKDDLIETKKIIDDIEKNKTKNTNQDIVKLLNNHFKNISNKYIIDDLTKEIERNITDFNQGIVLYSSKFNILSSFIGIIFTVTLGLTFYINQDKIFSFSNFAVILFLIGCFFLLTSFALTIYLSTFSSKYTTFDELKLIEVARKHNKNKNNYVKEKLITLFYSSIINFKILDKLKSRYKPISTLLILSIVLIFVFGSFILFSFENKRPAYLDNVISIKSENIEKLNETLIDSELELSNINLRLKNIGGN